MTDTELLENDINSRTCPNCGCRFSSYRGQAQHVALGVSSGYCHKPTQRAEAKHRDCLGCTAPCAVLRPPTCHPLIPWSSGTRTKEQFPPPTHKGWGKR